MLYGVRGLALEWMRSYLTNRKQYAFLGSTQSNVAAIKCGVPQGSILVPPLFNIYTNDVVNISNVLNMILFADDTNIFISGNNITDICITLNSELY